MSSPMDSRLMEFYCKVMVRALSHVSLCRLKHSWSCFIDSSVSDISNMNNWEHLNTSCITNLTCVELLSSDNLFLEQ
jgi:hypothetical protein